MKNKIKIYNRIKCINAFIKLHQRINKLEGLVSELATSIVTLTENNVYDINKLKKEIKKLKKDKMNKHKWMIYDKNISICKVHKTILTWMKLNNSTESYGAKLFCDNGCKDDFIKIQGVEFICDCGKTKIVRKGENKMNIRLIGTEKEKTHSFGILMNNFQLSSCNKDYFSLGIPEYDLKRVRKFLKKKQVKFIEQ